MSMAALMQEMADAGAPMDAIIIAVRALEARDAEIEQKRAVERDRKRRQRQRERDSHGTFTGQSADIPEPPLSLSPNENNSNPHTHTPVNISRARRGWPIPNGVSAEQWDAFCRQRKKALNPRAYELLTGKLVALARDGWPPGDLIDLAIERGWETVFEPKDHRNGNRPATDPLTAAIEASRAAENQDNDPGDRLAV
jgi:hypothetical protein